MVVPLLRLAVALEAIVEPVKQLRDRRVADRMLVPTQGCRHRPRRRVPAPPSLSPYACCGLVRRGEPGRPRPTMRIPSTRVRRCYRRTHQQGAVEILQGIGTPAKPVEGHAAAVEQEGVERDQVERAPGARTHRGPQSDLDFLVIKRGVASRRRLARAIYLARARSNLARATQGQTTPDVLLEDACFDAQQAVEKAFLGSVPGTIRTRPPRGLRERRCDGDCDTFGAEPAGRFIAFARPKSSTFTVPSSCTLMVAGFKSRWMMPRSCAASRASAICFAMGRASSGGIAPRAMRCERSGTHRRVPSRVRWCRRSLRDRRCRRCGDGSARRGSWPRDVTVQLGVARTEHLAHAAFADLGRDVVDAEAGAGS